jgi:hypothetical protein
MIQRELGERRRGEMMNGNEMAYDAFSYAKSS